MTHTLDYIHPSTREWYPHIRFKCQQYSSFVLKILKQHNNGDYAGLVGHCPMYLPVFIHINWLHCLYLVLNLVRSLSIIITGQEAVSYIYCASSRLYCICVVYLHSSIMLFLLLSLFTSFSSSRKPTRMRSHEWVSSRSYCVCLVCAYRFMSYVTKVINISCMHMCVDVYVYGERACVCVRVCVCVPDVHLCKACMVNVERP